MTLDLVLHHSIRKEAYMILRNEEERYIEEEPLRSRNDRDVEAVGSGTDGSGRGSR